MRGARRARVVRSQDHHGGSMTHGTDRDTPTGGTADRDAADVPDGTEAGVVRDGVPQQHDARDDVSDVVPPAGDVASATTPQDQATADQTAPAGGAPEGDEPAAVDPAPADEADEAAAVDPAPADEADEPAPVDPAPTAEADEPVAVDPAPADAEPEPAVVAPAAPETAAVPTPVAGPRPLAPVTDEPLAAWPSWDDVAVTAPTPPDAAGTTDDGAAPDATPAGTPDGTPDDPASDDGAETAASADEAPGNGEATPAALPPLSLGGLSALAFTALNAASVGVPAHALPQSPLPHPDAGDDDRSGPAAGATGSEGEPVASDEEPAGPGADRATPAADPAVETPAAEVPEAAPAAAAAAPTGPRPPAASRVDETSVVSRVDETAVSRVDETAIVPASSAAGPPASPRPSAAAPPDSPEPSLLDGFEPEHAHRRWTRPLAVTGGALALVAALYVGSSYALADRVPRGATVAGVEIGSMSSGEAEQHLTEALAERATSPVPVVAQEVQAELDPVAAGLELDAGATVARLTGVDLTQPVRLWRHLVGVGEQPPVTVVDEDALDAELTQLSGSLMLAPVDGTVVFADGAAHATEAVDGWELDAGGASTVLEEGWLTAARPVALPTSVVAPAVSQAETDRALSQLARPLTAAPVTVQVADRQAVLDVATLTAHAAIVPQDGILQLQLDGAALSEAVLAQLPDLLTTAADARFEFQDGAPVIIPGTPGTTLDPTALATSVAQAATTGTGRVAPVDLVQSDPAQTQEALEALGVKEVVSEFSTPLTSEPRRTGNIANGLKNITGTLVRPGETFSLTEALGPVDAAHGYVQAGAIVNGEHKDAWGGGLSQVSTTTYNAAYFAGFEDVEHTPHSEWFQRYPEGREATIFTGVLDLKWKNNTPYGALVQGFVADGRAHVRIWSTKHFTVETTKSGRSGVVSPTTVYSQSPTCEPQSAGNPGFTVTNTRRVFLNGEEVDSESHTWRYKPQNKVICGAAPVPGAAPTP